MTHGGKREGAGRPGLEGRLTRCYALTQQHVDVLDQYRIERGLTSASEALRDLLENQKLCWLYAKAED